jgi:hypothetical protein
MSIRIKGKRFGRGILVLALAAVMAGVVAMSVRAQTTQPAGERQPAIITNQFNTTSGGSLNERRPGLMIQQAIALNQGTDILTGDIPPDDTFFQDTFYMIFEAIIDGVSNFLQTLNLASTFGDFDLPFLDGGLGDGLGNGDSTPDMVTIPNSTTTGQGNTTTVP